MQAVKRLYLPEASGADAQLHKENGGVSKAKAAVEAVLSFLVLAAFLLAVRDLMPGVLSLVCPAIVGAAVILLLTFTRAKEKTASIANTVLYVATVAVFLIFILYVAQGFLLTVSRALSLANSRFGTEFNELSVDERAGLGAVLFWSLLAVPLTVFIVSAVRKRVVGRLLILLFLALLFACLLGRTLLAGKAVLLAAALLGCFLYAASPDRKCGVMFWSYAAALLVFAGVLFAVSGVYPGSLTLKHFRKSVAEAYEKLRYGEDTLPQGDLSEAQGLLDGEEETLRVTMENPQELYLKGYVGAVYTGTSWDTVSLDAYQGDNAGILNWLSQNGLISQTQYAKKNALSQQASGVSSVEVENTGAYRKYVYLPESAEDWDAPHSAVHKDWQVESSRFFGAKTYTFTVVDDAETAEQATPENWMQSPSDETQETYLQAESVYHAFVEEQYTALDDDMRTLMEETFFSDLEQDVSEMDLWEITTQIRRVLRTEASYTTKPSAMPADADDYVSWFLTEERKGNAVAFASAAVLAYRAAGYPARYVEGYRISEETAQALADADEHTAVLHNEDAHAWVEIYVSGSGWMPVEVVPGMYTEIYTDQKVEGHSSYQVNPAGEDENFQVDDNGEQGGSDYEEKTKPDKPITAAQLLGLLVLAAYLLFFLVLILEAVRAARIAHRKRRTQAETFSAEAYLRRLRTLLHAGGVKGEFDDPRTLGVQVTARFGADCGRDYKRVIALLEKVRFGGRELKPHEIHTLECFVDALQKKLRDKKTGRLLRRYVYAL